MDRRSQLAQSVALHGLLAVYLFGSRADDGVRLLRGETVEREGSDLDVGIFFEPGRFDAGRLGSLQVEMEDVFAPLCVDLVPLDRVDSIFQFRAVDGTRVAESDSTRADEKELLVMRRAAELLPIQRAIERARFGVSTT